MLGARIDLAAPKDNRLRFAPRLDAGPLPDEVDWREKGYVTAVKDQVCIALSQFSLTAGICLPLGLCKWNVSGVWKTVGIPTAHVSP